MSKLSDKLDVPLSPSLYYEWLNSPDRFKMYYDQWLEKQVLSLRQEVLAYYDIPIGPRDYK